MGNKEPEYPWIAPEDNLDEHLRKIKYPEIAELVGILNRSSIAYLIADESFIAEQTSDRYFDDVHIMVKEDDWPRSTQALSANRWTPVRDYNEEGYNRELTEEENRRLDRMTYRPCEFSFVSEVRWPARLWLNLMTTWRRRGLCFVDLADWFLSKRAITAFGGVTITVPGAEELLVLTTSEVFNKADWNHLAEAHLRRLSKLIQADGPDWSRAVSLVERYQSEQELRLKRMADLGETLYSLLFQQVQVLSGATPPARLTHGNILNAFCYCIEAVSGLGSPAIPDSVLDYCRSRRMPRSIWSLVGQGDFKYGDGYEEFYATTSLSLLEQIEQFGGRGFFPIDQVELLVRQRVTGMTVTDAMVEQNRQKVHGIFAPL